MLESARDLTIEAAVSASTRLSETPTAKRPQEISKLLNSRIEREVLNGMKCVMALICHDEDATQYFADVVKNVTLANSRVRALVLIYLQRYAENEPDTALLLINSIQKSLGDKKPNVRLASIRTLGGIRIPEIASLLVLCIKRTTTDSLPQVRAATALALGKAYSIDGVNKTQLAQHLYSLLSDRSPVVVDAAIKVYFKLKPELMSALAKKAWAPIHSNFRRYTRILPQLDEWGMSFMLDILAEYSRRFLPRPKLILDDGTEMEVPDSLADFPQNYTCEMDSDLQMFVDSVGPLASSLSDVVVLSAVKALATVATPEKLQNYGYVKVLTKIATKPCSLPTKLYALEVVLKLAQMSPQLFQKNFHKFFLFPQESLEVSTTKLHILLAVFTEASAKAILSELQYCALSQKREVAKMAVNVIDVCSQMSPRWSNKVLKWCLHNLENSSATSIISELLSVIRHLLQEKLSNGYEKEPLVRTIYKLSLLLNDSNVYPNAEAKASIIWIIGEFTAACENLIGPDVLRRSLKTFTMEPDNVRYELLVLAAKSYLYELLKGDDTEVANSRLGKIFKHIMHLCHYDSSYDTRDRVRMWEQLLVNSENHQLATLFLEVPKPTPVAPKPDSSSSLTTYYLPVPWSDQQDLPPKSIRKEAEVAAQVTHMENGIMGKRANQSNLHAISSDLILRSAAPTTTQSYQLQSLDEFFANDSESENEQSEESEEESEVDSDEEASGESEGDDDSLAQSSSEDGESDSDASSEDGNPHGSRYLDDDQVSVHSNQEFI